MNQQAIKFLSWESNFLVFNFRKLGDNFSLTKPPTKAFSNEKHLGKVIYGHFQNQGNLSSKMYSAITNRASISEMMVTWVTLLKFGGQRNYVYQWESQTNNYLSHSTKGTVIEDFKINYLANVEIS